MPAVTPTYNLPYPVSSDPPDVPSDMKKLAEAIVLALDAMNGKLEFPIGTIIPLNPGAPIPTGWRLCNGTGGTPNLAGRTLIGVGAGPGGTYTAGQTGGAATVTLTAATSGIGIHQHVGSATVNIPAHTHTVPSSSVTTASATVSHNHSASSGSASQDHTHAGWTGSNNRGHTHTGNTHGMNRNASHHHLYTASQAINNVLGVAGLQDQSPNLHRGNIAIGRHTVGTSATDTNHEHGITTGAQSANHEHLITTGGASHIHQHAITVNTASPAHSHTLTVPSSTTNSAAPVAGGQVSMQDSQPKDAQQAHENRMPYYVVNYIMKVA